MGREVVAGVATAARGRGIDDVAVERAPFESTDK